MGEGTRELLEDLEKAQWNWERKEEDGFQIKSGMTGGRVNLNPHCVILNLIQDPGVKPRDLVMKERMDPESSSG